jgi:hypothetical protein
METKNKIYGITVKERKSFPIMAGMKFGTNDYKIKKVGTKIIEFTFDVNPNNADDKMLLSEKEISRKFIN